MVLQGAAGTNSNGCREKDIEYSLDKSLVHHKKHMHTDIYRSLSYSHLGNNFRVYKQPNMHVSGAPRWS